MAENRRIIVPNQPTPPMGFTYGIVRSAIQQIMQGSFDQGVILGTSMLTDSAFSAAVNKRTQGLTCLPVRCCPVDETNVDPNDPVLEGCQYLIEDMIHEGVIDDLLLWYLVAGASVGYNQILQVDGQLIPKPKQLPPDGLVFDGDRTWTYSYQGGQAKVTPGQFDENGVSWILLEDGYASMRRSFVVSLAQTWAFKQYSISDWKDWNENYSGPLVALKFPIAGNDDQKEAFFAEWQQQGAKKVIALPQRDGGADQGQYDIDVTDLTGGGWDSYKAVIDYCDAKFQIGINGGNLSSQIDGGGSYAAAMTHLGNERRLTKRDADIVCRMLRQQVLLPYVQLNFDPAATLADVPYVVFECDPPDDLKSKAESLTLFIDFYTKLKSSGLQVDNIAELAESYGLVVSDPTIVDVAQPQDAPEDGMSQDQTEIPES